MSGLNKTEFSVFHTWLYMSIPSRFIALYTYQGYSAESGKHVLFLKPRRKPHEMFFAPRIECTTLELYSLFHKRILFPACYTTEKLKDTINALI